MKTTRTLVYLSLLIALLAAFYAAVGLFSQGGDGPFTAITIRGESVEMYGRGLYRNDSAFKAPILRGTDAVTLFICVPVLLLSTALYRRGSLRGRLLLVGVLSYFLYNSASLALGAAYNPMLLAYIACLSASLFAFLLAFGSVDLPTLAAQTSSRLPRRWVAAFVLLSGLSVLIWLADIIIGLAQGFPPTHLGPYTTEVTYVLDLSVILPASFLTAALVWRRTAMGTLLASILITFVAFVGPMVASQTAMQLWNGIELTPTQYVTYVAPFLVLSVVAVGLLVSILHSVSEPTRAREERLGHDTSLP